MGSSQDARCARSRKDGTGSPVISSDVGLLLKHQPWLRVQGHSGGGGGGGQGGGEDNGASLKPRPSRALCSGLGGGGGLLLFVQQLLAGSSLRGCEAWLACGVPGSGQCLPVRLAGSMLLVVDGTGG